MSLNHLQNVFEKLALQGIEIKFTEKKTLEFLNFQNAKLSKFQQKTN